MSTAASSAESGAASGTPSGEQPGRGPSEAPRRPLRVFWRTAVIVAGTASLGTLLGLAWLPTFALRRSGPAKRARLRRAFVRLWGKGMLRVLGVRLSTTGTPPDRGSMIVSNHLSYLDIATLASVLPTVFVSKAEVRGWPFWGPMAAMAGTIFIDRGRKRDTVRVLAEMDEAFARGDSVVVFPEATSTDGATIMPFKTSLLASAAEERNPVAWATVSYRTPDAPTAARTSVCWWGDMTFLPHFTELCSLERIEATVTFGDETIRSSDRRALAEALRTNMLARFTPVA